MVNRLRSFDLAWAEIERFSIGRWTIFPFVCLTHIVDGLKLHLAAVNEGTWRTSGKGVRMMEELNEELRWHKADEGPLATR